MNDPVTHTLETIETLNELEAELIDALDAVQQKLIHALGELEAMFPEGEEN